jgi:microcompartment protein CcmL/EutN
MKGLLKMGYAIGLVEMQALVAAIETLDVMLKTADVEFVAVERKLGGRLVTIVVRGSISAVTAAVEAGCKAAERMGHLKAHEVIARPHPEILKFLHLSEDE